MKLFQAFASFAKLQSNSNVYIMQSVTDKVNTFNKAFPVGSKLFYRTSPREQYLEYTNNSLAFEDHGVAVTSFKEIHGLYSVDPIYIKDFGEDDESGDELLPEKNHD